MNLVFWVHSSVGRAPAFACRRSTVQVRLDPFYISFHGGSLAQLESACMACREVDGSSPLRSMSDFLLAISFTEHQTCAHSVKGIVNISCWAGSVDFENASDSYTISSTIAGIFVVVAFAKTIIIFSLKQKMPTPYQVDIFSDYAKVVLICICLTSAIV